MRTVFVLIFLFALTGCGNLNPRLDEKIDNTNGKIDSIKNNQNGIQADIGNLKQSADIQNSKLKEVQEGVFNLNAALSKNENSGVQILQGDGALVLVFGLGVVGMLLWFFHNKAVKAEKTADIIATEVIKHGDQTLHENILKAAMHSPVESEVYHLIVPLKFK